MEDDIGYKRFDEQFADSSGAPPSYDAVIGDPTPSAPPPGPPIQHQRAPIPEHLPPPSVQQPSGHSKSAQSGPSKLVKSYVSYSMAHHLRKYMVPKRDRLDPELDVEAQFSRRAVREAQSSIAKGMRLQCITGWLWCFGVILILFHTLLPAGLLAVGIVGYDSCPYDSKVIVIYLLLGGSLLTMLVVARLLPSLMTCGRNRNYFNTGQSATCLGCICTLEVLFYMLLVANLAVLIVGTIEIFQDSDIPSCTSTVTTDCCKTTVYVASAFLNIFQYLLYGITAIYGLLVVCCVKNMDKVYDRR